MMTDREAHAFAEHWIASWNSHDLTTILSHYGNEVVLTSPVVARILNDSGGKVMGKDALRAYFKKALEAYPNLTFQLVDALKGLSSVVLYYVNHVNTKTAEFMEFDETGKVIRVVANYSI
jgi:hypothetical protein